MSQVSGSLPQPSPAWTEDSGPVGRRDRIVVLDVIRGLALLGILTPFQEHLAPARHLTDSVTLLLVRGLALGKFYPLFSLLFGIGVGLQLIRTQDNRQRVGPLFARRFLALYVGGSLFYVLVDHNDILVTFGVVGWVLLVVRSVSSRWLLAACAVCALVSIVYPVTMAMDRAAGPAVSSASSLSESVASALTGDERRGVRRSRSYEEWVRRRAVAYGRSWPFLRPANLAHVVALCLLGLLATRTQILQSVAQDRSRLRSLTERLLGAGLVGAAVVVLVETFIGTSATALYLGLRAIHVVLGPILSLGYAALITYVIAFCGVRLNGLACAGRMALTNFIAQSVAMTGLFYGFGIGLEGTVGPMSGVLIGCLIWFGQVKASQAWLRRFQFGPAEWIWRTITYSRRQPLLSI